MTRLMIASVFGFVGVVALSLGAATPSPSPSPSAAPAPKATSGPAVKTASGPASSSPTSASAPAVPLTPAQEAMNKAATLYLKNDPAAFNEAYKAATKLANLTPAQRGDLTYMHDAMAGHHPNWWLNCRSSTNVSFQATIWGKNFAANYMPDDMLGMQAPVGVKNGKIAVIVCWKPSMVDSPKAAEGYFAERFGMTKGDLAEAIVWHELGHNYVTCFLPLDVVLKLYDEFPQIFSTVQEFYADMSALYHSSPHARLATMAMRIDGIEDNRDEEAHNRASQGIGSLLLTNWLMEPAKWPSIHFPPAIPPDEIERRSITYVYGHIDVGWTVAEDRALRELVKKYMETKGDSTLRSKGEVQLPNKLSFKMIATDDRDLQKKRDAWVAAQLKSLIDSGRADKPDPKADKNKFDYRSRTAVVLPW